MDESIFHLQNAMFAQDPALRDPNHKHIFTGPRYENNTGQIECFVWNVSDYVPPHGKKCHVLDNFNRVVNIADWERTENPKYVDTRYAASLCIQKIVKHPVLMVQYAEPGTKQSVRVIADGNHRLWRAAQARLKTYPAYLLTLAESEEIRLPNELAIQVWEKVYKETKHGK